jgi:hypothetical protein
MPDDYLIISWDLFVFLVVAKVACTKASVISLEERATVDPTPGSSLGAGFGDLVVRWAGRCVMPTEGYLWV